MRDIDGLQPQEAFDELLKFLFFKQANEALGPQLSFPYDISFDGLLANSNKRLVENVKELFAEYVISFNSWFSDLWKDTSFHLSDAVLLTLGQIFNAIEFSQIPFDVRSAALREFLSPELRRGLGIYLTPDDVVRMMVEYVNPTADSSVYDPACGSGTFLIETLKLRESTANDNPSVIWGTDKNPRMLLLAELNLGHFPGVVFKRRVIDALFPEIDAKNDWPIETSFDIIFTNPPFGVSLDNATCDLRMFRTCRGKDGYLVKRQQSEVMFIEKTFEYLKPGGILAIVLPRSVITNATLHTARQVFDKLGYVYAMVSLPPETFATAGTQTSTVILFVKKFTGNEHIDELVSIAYADVTNVGYDATGRSRNDNQLISLAQNLQLCSTQRVQNGVCRLLPNISKHATFSELSSLIAAATEVTSETKLRDVVQLVTTGRTPPRRSYTDEGLFLVKVGNLTGNGISWMARDRNFISFSEMSYRIRQQLILQKGDILLTSSAHSSVYIAKKVDIVDDIPEWVGGKASFVGEIMLIRPDRQKIDPFILLAYLRLPTVMQQIQRLVRGQTAHLYADDMLELPLPQYVLNPNHDFEKVADILRLEAKLNNQLNHCAFQQAELASTLTVAYA